MDDSNIIMQRRSVFKCRSMMDLGSSSWFHPIFHSCYSILSPMVSANDHTS